MTRTTQVSACTAGEYARELEREFGKPISVKGDSVKRLITEYLRQHDMAMLAFLSSAAKEFGLADGIALYGYGEGLRDECNRARLCVASAEIEKMRESLT